MDHLSELKVLSQAIFNKKKYGQEQEKRACKAHFEQLFKAKEFLYDGLTIKAEKTLGNLRNDLTKRNWIPQFFNGIKYIFLILIYYICAEDAIADRILGKHNHAMQLYDAGCFRCISEKLIAANSALASEALQAKTEAKVKIIIYKL
jgi:hypothetical protein